MLNKTEIIFLYNKIIVLKYESDKKREASA